MAIALAQPKDEMLFVHYPGRRDRLDLARKKKRLGVSVSKRLQHFMPPQKIYVDFGERQLIVHSHAGLKSFFGKDVTCSFAKCFSKALEIFLVQCKTGRHFMSTKFIEFLRA